MESDQLLCPCQGLASFLDFFHNQNYTDQHRLDILYSCPKSDHLARLRKLLRHENVDDQLLSAFCSVMQRLTLLVGQKRSLRVQNKPHQLPTYLPTAIQSALLKLRRWIS